MADTYVRPRRINVAVNEDELRAINLLIEREEVSLTEAVRRLISYGEFLYRAIKVDGDRVAISGQDGTFRTEIVLV